MKVIPALQTKPRKAAEPGELIRVRQLNDICWGIAARDTERKTPGVVLLSPSAPPIFRPTSAPAMNQGDTILSYGWDWGIHIRPNARMTPDGGPPGTLVLNPGPALIQLFALISDDSNSLLDVSTGELIAENPATKCWFCLDWEIRLDYPAAPDSVPIFTFAAAT